MTDYYVDPDSGSSTNSGAQHSPKRYIHDFNLAPLDRVFMRAGRVHPIWNYRFIPGGCAIDRYSDGPNPIFRKAKGGDAWLYVQNGSGVRLSNFAMDCAGEKGAALSLHAKQGDAVSDAWLENLELYGSPDNSGLVIAGSAGGTVRRVTVVKTISRNHFYHGVHVQMDVQNVLFEDDECGYNGFGRGAHGFTAWGTPAAAPRFIWWVRCYSHHTFDADGSEGQGIQADDNSSDCVALLCRSEHNGGAGFALNNSPRGVIANSYAAHNGGAAVAVSKASPAARITRNSFIDNMLRKTNYAAVHVAASASGAQILDNILIGTPSQRAVSSPPGTVNERNTIVGMMSA